MQTNPAVEQSKIVKWSESSWNQSGRKGKGLWRKRFAEEPKLSFYVHIFLWTAYRSDPWIYADAR